MDNAASFPPSTEEFKEWFSEKTLSRAHQLVATDAVTLLERSETRISAKVRGTHGDRYLVTLSASAGGADDDFDCTCPSDVQPCKHIGAVFLLLARQTKQQPQASLEQTIDTLAPNESNTWLKKLADIPQVRVLMLQHQEQQAERRTPTGRLNTLVRVLTQGGNIEHDDALGEDAFVQLLALAAATRSKKAWDVYELLGEYEPRDDYDDEYSGNGYWDDESGTYWEDRIDDWQALALNAWASAEFELQRATQAHNTLLSLLEHNEHPWAAVLWLTQHEPDLRDVLWAWLNDPRNHAAQNKLERWRREHLRLFQSPQSYEKHLRQNLHSVNDHQELMVLLQSQERHNDALAVAALGVRETMHKKSKSEWFWGSSVERLASMLEYLRTQSPGFEWEHAAFVLQPSLTQYQALKHFEEFATQRVAILKTNMLNDLRLQLLLDDNDTPALQAFLQAHPAPEHAARLTHLFPKECAEILLKAVHDEIAQTSRQHYQQAVQWLRVYKTVVEKTIFDSLIKELHTTHKRRHAFLDELSKAKWKP